jgi:replication factor C subunit 3/5
MSRSDQSIPWVEKYRPKSFGDIVLDPVNRTMMENMLSMDRFPNLLLYGPPGTGKTTTIMNLINRYQESKGEKDKGLTIHLNASDERGIDVIRNHISQFVNSNPLFHKGMKFVVLDEVDYMTKSAQQALKCLLQRFNQGVRFCLICNYIARIDGALQNEFVRFRFNELPAHDVQRFLSTINERESIGYTAFKLQAVQRQFGSDMRSMINFMQSNREVDGKVIDDAVWEGLTASIKEGEGIRALDNLTTEYCVDVRNALKDYINYLIRSRNPVVTIDFLRFAEFILHLRRPQPDQLTAYSVQRLESLLG